MYKEVVFTRYRCTCSKCGKAWVTKEYELPAACPGCHRVTWNDDQEVVPKVATQPSAPELPKWSLTVLPDLDEMPADVPAGPTWRFTKDGPQYADDGNVYRKQYMVENPKRVRSVEVEELDHETVVRVL